MKKSAIALLLGLTTGCLLFPGQASAATKPQNIENTHKLSVDLDGDGVKENLKFVYKSGEENGRLSIYVNGKKQYSVKGGEYSWLGELYLADFDESDSMKDIYLQFAGNSDCLEFTKVLQYKDKKLTVVNSRKENYNTLFSGRLTLADTQKGDGRITFSVDTPFFSEGLFCYYVNMDYKMQDGKLVKCNQNLYPVSNNWKQEDYKINHNMTFTTKANTKTVAFKAKKGEVLHLNAIYCKGKDSQIYIQMKNSEGKTGWYKVTNKQFFEGEKAWG